MNSTPARSSRFYSEVRRHYYEHYGVSHYWTANPLTQQMQFWQHTSEGYQPGSLDADGSYRGVPGLTFTPALLWVKDDRFPALPLGLPIVAGEGLMGHWYRIFSYVRHYFLM